MSQQVTSEEVKQAIQHTTTMAEAARNLGLPFSTFKRRAELLGLYKPNQARPGEKKSVSETQSKGIPLEEILQGKHPNYNPNNLKRRLLQTNILQNVCYACGLTNTWNGKPITLQLDHIDGDCRNHRLSNLRLACPNCHSQTPTYCGRNRKTKAGNCPISDHELLTEYNKGAGFARTLKALNIAESKSAFIKLAKVVINGNASVLTKIIETTSNIDAVIKLSGLPDNTYIRKQLCLTFSALSYSQTKHKNAAGTIADYNARRAVQRAYRLKRLEEKIRRVNVDYSKFGWVTKLATALNIKPQKVHALLVEVAPDLLKGAMQRKST